MNKTEYQDLMAFHPGYYVEDVFQDMQITQEEFAKRLGTTPKTISLLFAGKAPMSRELAIKLSNMLGTSVDVWLNLQVKYNEKVAEIESAFELEQEKRYLKHTDYQYFVKLGVVPDTPHTDEKIKHLRQYLQIASLKVLTRSDFLVSYRNSIESPTEKNTVNANAWLQTAINFGKQIDAAPYNRAKLKAALPVMRKLTRDKPAIFYPKLVDLLSDCGVSFVLLPHLQSSGIHGAVKWVNKEKVILAMSDRRKTVDSFWFSFFHEIQHVLQQKIKQIIITNDKEQCVAALDEKLEEEDDEFAKNVLIPEERYSEFLAGGHINRERIVEFANTLEIDPSILLGRLQKEKKISYRFFNNLKKPFTSIPILFE